MSDQALFKLKILKSFAQMIQYDSEKFVKS